MASKDGVKNFLKRAKKANPGNGKFTFKDAIGMNDADDLYRMKLGASSNLNLKVKGLRVDTDVEVYSFDQPKKKVLKKIGKTDFSDIKSKLVDKFLNVEADGSSAGSKKIKLKTDLEANQYYIRVTSSDTDKESKYKVVMKATELPQPEEPPITDTSGGDTTSDPTGDTTGGTGGGTGGDTGGGTPAPTIPPDGNDTDETAKTLPISFVEKVYSNSNLPPGFTEKTFYLGNSDQEDWFKFDLKTRSTFNLSLNDLSTNVDVYLYNVDGQTLMHDGTDIVAVNPTPAELGGSGWIRSAQFGTSAEAIEAELPIGTYLIKVDLESVGETNYSIGVSALPTDYDAWGAGNDANNARELLRKDDPSYQPDPVDYDLVNGTTITDFVGGKDPNDFFKVTIGNPSDSISEYGTINLRLNGDTGADIDGLDSSDIDIEIIPASSFIGSEGDLTLPSEYFSYRSSREQDSQELLSQTLDEGDYYIRVYPAETTEDKIITEDYGAYYDMYLEAYTVFDRPALTKDVNEISSGSVTGKLFGDPPDSEGGTGGSTGVIYFFANDGSGKGYELWQSSGTPDSTEKAEITGNNALDSLPTYSLNLNHLANLQGDIFFTVTAQGQGTQLYVYTGSSINLVEKIGTTSSHGVANDPQFLVADDKLYFVANDGSHGVWVTDGTAAGTEEVFSTTDASPELTFIESGSYLYYNSGTSIHRYNTNTKQTEQITGSYTTGSDSKLTLVGDTLYFIADNTSSNKTGIWKINENAATEVPAGGAPLNADPSYGEFTAFDGTLYFVATNSTNSEGLWRVNNTGTGFDQVTISGDSIADLNPRQLTVLKDGTTEKLYFVGKDSSEIDTLWSIEDTNLSTAASVEPDLDLFAGLDKEGYEKTTGLDLTSSELIVIGPSNGSQTLYFTAETPATGKELFRVEGSESISGISNPFANIRPDTIVDSEDLGSELNDISGSDPRSLVEVGNRLYFIANNNYDDPDTGEEVGAGDELWVFGIKKE